MKVYAIEDEKYGVQLICKTEELAKKYLATGKYDISGYGSVVTEWEVREK